MMSVWNCWIGWNAAGGSAGIDRAFGMSRFVIRQRLRCRNLASMALTLFQRSPWENSFDLFYGVRALPDKTCVGHSHFGRSLCAAAWTFFGESMGRRRQLEIESRRMRCGCVH